MDNKISIMFLAFIFFPLLSCSRDNDDFQEYSIEIDTQTNDTIIKVNSDTIIIDKKDTIITEKQDTIITGKNDTLITLKNDTIISETIHKDTIICSHEKYMDLTPTVSNAQGAACYDKYFIQGYANNSALEIYDLDSKKYLCKLDISTPTPSSKIHVNSVCFGNQRVSSDDFFPLLYISSGYTQNVNGSPCSFIYVYRLCKDVNQDLTKNFSVELVQTIALKGFGSWTEGIPDNDHNALWVKYEPTNTNGEYRYAVFQMPRVQEGDVTIDVSDATKDFSVGIQPFVSSNQGHLYYNDRIYLVSGISPQTQILALIIINTLTCSRELVLDLTEIGLYDEPENIIIFKGQLMIGYRKSLIKMDICSNNNNYIY